MRLPIVHESDASATVGCTVSRHTAVRAGDTSDGRVRQATTGAGGCLGWRVIPTLGLLFIFLPMFAGPLDAPMLESQTLFSWDTDGDGTDDFKYHGDVIRLGFADEVYNTVTFTFRTSLSARLLRPTKNRIPFQPSEPIGGGAVVFSSGAGGAEDNWMWLLSYDEVQDFPGALWRYRDNIARLDNAAFTFHTNQTDLLVGVRFTAATGIYRTSHYGWFRFTRPEARFTNAFTLAAYDWNPLPGAPIAAGQPPVIPVVPTVTPEGQLRLTWPAAVTNWVLEATDRVGMGGKWEPVPNVSGVEAQFAIPETNRFFRLRRP